MKNIEFPIFKTKVDPSPLAKGEGFNLTDRKEREEYFDFKAGKEIKKLKSYLKDNSFIAYLLGPKSSGKGTYAKMFREVVAEDKIEHFSIGDMVREIGKELGDERRRKELISSLEESYRGWVSLEEAISALGKRDTKTLTVPTELLLALVKREIEKRGKKALFIDGFPRNMNQISYSLFFRDLIDYRQDSDIFVLIDVPETVIDERIKYRVVCPVCQTSRNLKLLPTKKVGYDKKEDKFYLICDNPACEGKRMVAKEGDELGIESIRERLKTDKELMKKAFSLYGIPKVLLRNSIPVDKSKDYVDNYEITPEFVYEWNGERVKVSERPWEIKDEKGKNSYSLMPPPVVVSLIKQIVEVLKI